MSTGIRCAALLALIVGMAAGVQGQDDGKGRNAMSDGQRTEVVTLGGGCFWCLEAVFEEVPGVKSVVSGYAGGTVANPSYKEVCTGTTGHAEVVQITYDPAVVTLEKILKLFWSIHDPTTMNQQGADVGTQYRSIILYANDAQRKAAEASRDALVRAKTFDDPVVTEIVPLRVFFRAEEYHQGYFKKNPNAPYCMLVISPKLKKLEKLEKGK
jgi:methionine-S-sulfoxide reductase